MPANSEKEPRARDAAGLCARCKHAQIVVSERGSQFVLCRLSAIDSRFAKYPRLPVLMCPGYEPNFNS